MILELVMNIRSSIKSDDMQFGSISGCGTTDATLI